MGIETFTKFTCDACGHEEVILGKRETLTGWGNLTVDATQRPFFVSFLCPACLDKMQEAVSQIRVGEISSEI